MESGGHWSASLWRWGLCVTMASLSLWKVVELAVSGDASWGRVLRKKAKKEQYLAGFPGLVGNTPMVELTSLSKATGCDSGGIQYYVQVCYSQLTDRGGVHCTLGASRLKPSS